MIASAVLAQADPGVVGQDPQIAGQGQLAAPAGRSPTHGGDGRKGEIGQAVTDCRQTRDECADVVDAHGATLLEVGPGTEVLARGTQDEHSRLSVRA